MPYPGLNTIAVYQDFLCKSKNCKSPRTVFILLGDDVAPVHWIIPESEHFINNLAVLDYWMRLNSNIAATAITKSQSQKQERAWEITGKACKPGVCALG